MKRQALPSHGLLSAYDKQFKVADKRHANTPLTPTNANNQHRCRRAGAVSKRGFIGGHG